MTSNIFGLQMDCPTTIDQLNFELTGNGILAWVIILYFDNTPAVLVNDDNYVYLYENKEYAENVRESMTDMDVEQLRTVLVEVTLSPTQIRYIDSYNKGAKKHGR